jgi:hypothetical protein
MISIKFSIILAVAPQITCSPYSPNSLFLKPLRHHHTGKRWTHLNGHAAVLEHGHIYKNHV